MNTNTNKLHLGCGPKFFPGWFHIDALDYPHIDHQGAVEKLDFIESDSVEIIYACHLLEHFGRHDFQDALTEWFRVLKPGGVLRLAVPDYAACAQLFVDGKLDNGVKDILGLMMGGQKDKYDYHCMIFDEKFLTEILMEIGFSKTRHWDWRETEHSHIDDFSQAYLPHMDKDKGTLVSLNLEAVK